MKKPTCRLYVALADWVVGYRRPKKSRLRYDDSDECEQVTREQLDPPKRQTELVEEKRDTTRDYLPIPVGGLTP